MTNTEPCDDYTDPKTTGYSYWTTPDGTEMWQPVDCEGLPTGPAVGLRPTEPVTSPVNIPRWLAVVAVVGFLIVTVARLILGEWLAAFTALAFTVYIATGATWRTIPRNRP